MSPNRPKRRAKVSDRMLVYSLIAIGFFRAYRARAEIREKNRLPAEKAGLAA
jgi:hypothetical protein